MKDIQQADTRLKREVDYRLSKWIITNIEQLLEPDEIEEIWRELLSFYSPPTASVENVCGTMTGGGLGKCVAPARTMDTREAGDQNGDGTEAVLAGGEEGEKTRIVIEMHMV